MARTRVAVKLVHHCVCTVKARPPETAAQNVLHLFLRMRQHLNILFFFKKKFYIKLRATQLHKNIKQEVIKDSGVGQIQESENEEFKLSFPGSVPGPGPG